MEKINNTHFKLSHLYLDSIYDYYIGYNIHKEVSFYNEMVELFPNDKNFRKLAPLPRNYELSNILYYLEGEEKLLFRSDAISFMYNVRNKIFSELLFGNRKVIEVFNKHIADSNITNGMIMVYYNEEENQAYLEFNDVAEQNDCESN